MPKLNCWEFMECGRETGGVNSDELGVCPATVTTEYDGMHGGKNAGRACWMVAGTFCRGIIQGTFAKKYGDCRVCEFYSHVKFAEYPDFHPALIG
ncbi:MAG: two-CW domain-containing protein [Candidatus Geothermincolia bacterium]